MAILKNCEIHFAKLDPKRPNSKFNKKNPTWELQLRTYSKEQKKEWEALNLGVKVIMPDDDDEKPFFRVNLRKKSIKENGEASEPVRVVNGALENIDPNTIGNGSIAHVRIFQYEYPKEGGGKGIATVLMGIQLVKHIVYTPKPREDDFEMEETEVVTLDSNSGDEGEEKAPAKSSPKITGKTTNPDADY